MNPYQCKVCSGRHIEKECPVCADAKKPKKKDK